MDEVDPERTKVAVVDPLVGSVLDRRYRIEFRLAAGGFGAIYRATHVINRRAVALKVLHTTLATEPDVVARFRREAQALGALRNRHTIMAYDFGETQDGTLYIAMELLQGESLFERYRALGPLEWRRMVSIARQVCSSLAEAHAAGIVHRDLKPTNIHLEEVGGDPDFVKVLDFGIAKILHGSAIDNADLTRSGQMVGTFDYMAPEQMVGGQVSAQSDIFTLGVLLYEMISGERPFGDPQTAGEMLTAMLSRAPAPLSTISDAPHELDAVIARCLDRDPLKRYRSVTELDAALARVLTVDDTHTQLTVDFSPPGIGEDTATTIDQAPEGPTTAPQRAEVDPRTTLPGIAPPTRSTPWPFKDPRRKR
jgi:serine/threonine-protein kinase